MEVAACTLDDGKTIYLVDAPGFDDTTRTDTRILREVATWLVRAYNSKYKLAGIIDLHRIQDTRVGGTGARNLKMFHKLCGDRNLESFVLATTMWDLANPLRAQERKLELQNDEKLWAPMIKQGSKVMRQDQGRTSGLKIINQLVARKARITLEIQRELVDKKLRLEDTGAGRELTTVLKQLLQGYENRLREVEDELKKRDDDARKMLEEAKMEWEEKLREVQADTLNLQKTHEQLLEEQQKRFKQELDEKLQQAEADHAKNLTEQLKGQKRKMKSNYMRGMQDSSRVTM